MIHVTRITSGCWPVALSLSSGVSAVVALKQLVLTRDHDFLKRVTVRKLDVNGQASELQFCCNLGEAMNTCLEVASMLHLVKASIPKRST